jgi:hypothetical protein
MAPWSTRLHGTSFRKFKTPGMKITKISPSSPEVVFDGKTKRNLNYPDPHVVGAGVIRSSKYDISNSDGVIVTVVVEQFNEGWLRYMLDGKEHWVRAWLPF